MRAHASRAAGTTAAAHASQRGASTSYVDAYSLTQELLPFGREGGRYARTVTMTLRPAVVADAPGLVALWDDAYLSERSADGINGIERALRDDRLACIVAEVSGRLVGSVLAGFDGWRGNLYRLAVAPEFRGRGIAHALVARAEELLGDAGAARLNAIVDVHNEPAMRFWSAQGFELDPGSVRFVGRIPE